MRSTVLDAFAPNTVDTLPLRGRDRELSEVLRILEDRTVPGGKLVLVEGMTGSGKTRFLRECMGFAVRRGYDLHTGGPQWRAGPGIAEANGEGPVRSLVVVDDADRMSCADLDKLVLKWDHRGDGEVWLVARRPGAGTRRLDSRLPFPGRAPVRIGLGGLDRQAVRELTADVVGARPSAELTSLVAQADGNPQLVVELLQGLLEERTALVTGADAWLVMDQLPERLHRWAEAVLDECSPRCRQFLRLMAVLGDRALPGRSHELLGTRPTELLPLIEEARCASLLTTGPRLGFPSPLMRRVISDTVPEEWRLAMRYEAERVTSPQAPPTTENGTEAATDPETARTYPRRLTEQERGIVRLVAQGMTNRQVARRLTISPNTVNYHLKKLFRVYGASSRVELLGILRPYLGVIQPLGSGVARSPS